MATGFGEVPAHRPRTRALFHAPQPNRPTGHCAGPALVLRQGDEGLARQWRWADLPLLLLVLLLGPGTVRAADPVRPFDAGDGDTFQPSAAGLFATSAGLWSWRVTRATVPALAASSLSGLPAASPGRVVQTMVWVVRPALQLGLGVEQRWAMPGAPGAPGAATPGARDAGLLVGLRLDAGPRVHLTWRAPLWRPDAQNGEVQPRQMRVALALLPQDPYADLRRGLLTQVELSGQTTLALRPRGGRFGVLLSSHW